jgi:hypothetical protein
MLASPGALMRIRSKWNYAGHPVVCCKHLHLDTNVIPANAGIH